MPEPTLGSVAVDELALLAADLGVDADHRARACQTCAAMIEASGWFHRDPRGPSWPSGISHGRPYGHSFVLGAGAPELRWMLEAQDADTSALGYWSAGQRVTEWIAGQPGVDTRALADIERLFVPDATAPFRIWHGASVGGDLQPMYKVYLSARARGADQAWPTVRAAMDRLGLDQGRSLIEEACGVRDSPTILSLDLVDAARARVKLYVLSANRSGEEVEDLCQLGEQHQEGDALVFANELLGSVTARIWWLTCFNFVAGQQRPRSVTLHLGAPRHLPDETSLERVSALAKRHGSSYPLKRHDFHFVSFQRRGRHPRITVYFLPRGAE